MIRKEEQRNLLVKLVGILSFIISLLYYYPHDYSKIIKKLEQERKHAQATLTSKQTNLDVASNRLLALLRFWTAILGLSWVLKKAGLPLNNKSNNRIATKLQANSNKAKLQADLNKLQAEFKSYKGTVARRTFRRMLRNRNEDTSKLKANLISTRQAGLAATRKRLDLEKQLAFTRNVLSSITVPNGKTRNSSVKLFNTNEVNNMTREFMRLPNDNVDARNTYISNIINKKAVRVHLSQAKKTNVKQTLLTLAMVAIPLAGVAGVASGRFLQTVGGGSNTAPTFAETGDNLPLGGYGSPYPYPYHGYPTGGAIMYPPT